MPKSGDIVSFSFQSYSPRAIPVRPEIFRIRGELTWESVVKEYEKEMQEQEETEKEFSLNGMQKKKKTNKSNCNNYSNNTLSFLF